MFYDTLNSEDQVSYLIKPILEVLQSAGGQEDALKFVTELVSWMSVLLNSNRNSTPLVRLAISIRSSILSLTSRLKNLGMGDLFHMLNIIRR